jgi:hypothetical protein
MLGPQKNLGQNICGPKKSFPKEFLAQEIFGPKKFGQTKFWGQKLWDRKNLRKKKIWTEKILSPQKICKLIFPKRCLVKKLIPNFLFGHFFCKIKFAPPKNLAKKFWPKKFEQYKNGCKISRINKQANIKFKD